MRVPVEATDPDIVLHNCRDRIVELEGLLREHEGVTRDAVAVTLAGNALAGELAKALADIDRLQRELAEARAQIAAITPTADSETWRRACNDARDELAEARAQIAAKDKRIAELGSALDAPGLSGLVSWRRHDLTVKELAEAQAEIARLTPAAEAYRACVRWENASSYGTQEECASAWTEYLAATRRAIAFIPGATL